MPLERRVGLGREVGDRQSELNPLATARAALPLKPTDGFRNPQHIRIGFPGQPNHEIELDFVPTLFPGGFHAPQQFLIGQALINDVPQALGSRFRGKGQAALARAPEDIGDVLIEAIDPLAGQ